MTPLVWAAYAALIVVTWDKPRRRWFLVYCFLELGRSIGYAAAGTWWGLDGQIALQQCAIPFELGIKAVVTVQALFWLTIYQVPGERFWAVGSGLALGIAIATAFWASDWWAPTSDIHWWNQVRLSGHTVLTGAMAIPLIVAIKFPYPQPENGVRIHALAWTIYLSLFLAAGTCVIGDPDRWELYRSGFRVLLLACISIWVFAEPFLDRRRFPQ